MQKKQEKSYIGLKKYYNYLYLNKGAIDLSKVPEDRKKGKQVTFQSELKEDFDWIKNDDIQAIRFHYFLKNQKIDLIANLLYPDKTLPKEYQYLSQALPNDTDIQKKFIALNEAYQYLDPDEQTIEQFATLFKACKFMADFVEENNSANNDVAYLHAYKLLVLCGSKLNNPLENADYFISQFRGDSKTPIHDLLIYNLPVNHPKISLKHWQKIINDNGIKAIQLFQRAPEIEAYLKRPPKDFDDAQKAKSSLTYSRQQEHPELSQLCMDYNVSETAFNHCLDIKKHQKKSDNLPIIHVDGKECNLKRYHLVKLPFDDPRAYLLGHMTNCCQSIGGHSEQCVIDGITLQNNGFYVLLKAKKGKEDKSPFLEDNEHLNYQDYDLVGQGYAWMSHLNNLTFDSWENLTPSVDNAVIITLFQKFAQKLFQSAPDIFRLTIGTKGKTPAKLSKEPIIDPEVIEEGFSYGDAEKQYLISSNEERIQTLKKEIESELFEATQLTIPIQLISSKQALWIRKLIKDIQPIKENIRSELFEPLIRNAVTHTDILEVFHVILEKKPVNIKEVELLVESHDTQPLCKLIITLKKINPKLLPTDLTLLNDVLFCNEVTRGIELLGTELCTKENYELLMQHQVNACEFAESLSHLYDIDPTLTKDKRVQENIFKDSRKLSSLAMGLSRLKIANYKLITPEMISLFINSEIASNGSAQALGGILSCLYQINPDYLKNDSFMDTLNKHPEWLIKINHSLMRLTKKNPKLLSEEILKLLFANGYKAGDIEYSLLSLTQLNPDFFKDPSIMKLLSYDTKNFEGMTHAIMAIYPLNPALLQDESVIQLLTNTKSNFQELSVIFITLYSFNPDLKSIIRQISAVKETDKVGLGLLILRSTPQIFTPRNIQKLFDNQKYALELAYVLSELNTLDPKLLSDETLMSFIDKHPQDLNTIRIGLYALNPKCYALVTPELLEQFIALGPMAEHLAALYKVLYLHDPELIKLTHIQDFIKNAPDSIPYLASELETLHIHAPTLFNEEQICYLISLNASMSGMGSTLSILHRINPEFVKNETLLTHLVKNHDILRSINRALARIYQIDPDLITEQFIYSLTKEPYPASNIGDIFVKLGEINPQILKLPEILTLTNQSMLYLESLRLLLGRMNEKTISLESIELLLAAGTLDIDKNKIELEILRKLSNKAPHIFSDPKTIKTLKDNLNHLTKLHHFVLKNHEVELNDQLLNLLFSSGDNADKMAQLLITLYHQKINTPENNLLAFQLLKQGNHTDSIIQSIKDQSLKKSITSGEMGLFYRSPSKEDIRKNRDNLAPKKDQ